MTNDANFVFRNTPILHGRTEIAEMLPGGKMTVVEDVSATAVPSHTDLDGTVRGGTEVCSVWAKCI